MLTGSYTQIMVNPMQLTDAESTNWMEKLVEARKNRQEKRPRPYRNFRRPYNDTKTELKKPTLKNRLHVVEAVDLYNLDVDECWTA